MRDKSKQIYLFCIGKGSWIWTVLTSRPTSESSSKELILSWTKPCYTVWPCHHKTSIRSHFLRIYHCTVNDMTPLGYTWWPQWSWPKFVLSFTGKTCIFGEIFKQFSLSESAKIFSFDFLTNPSVSYFCTNHSHVVSNKENGKNLSLIIYKRCRILGVGMYDACIIILSQKDEDWMKNSKTPQTF